jgi:hypothetical protein
MKGGDTSSQASYYIAENLGAQADGDWWASGLPRGLCFCRVSAFQFSPQRGTAYAQPCGSDAFFAVGIAQSFRNSSATACFLPCICTLPLRERPLGRSSAECFVRSRDIDK